MQIGMIGLGRMGGNMTLRLLQDGHEVVAFDRSPDAVQAVAKQGAVAAESLRDLVSKLSTPRGVWIMVPAGDPVDQTIASLLPSMSPGDTIIDGGNSKWTDSMRRAGELEQKGFQFIDVGTSGGVWGLKVGYSMMIGGTDSAFQQFDPIFNALAPEGGYGHVGPPGAGHFVKMVHNGVEYGMMEAYGEGFEIFQASKHFDLDLVQIAGIWNHGSVVRSWLLELLEDALRKDPGLEQIRGYVEDSGEGRWTIEAAIDEDVPAPIITESLFRRFASRQQESFSAKVLAALRNEFGGHAVKPADAADADGSHS
ncbi:MAG TPA: decarboxylating 6-phosphogluconate dehydrogenase [Chloroflexota bacterium]